MRRLLFIVFLLFHTLAVYAQSDTLAFKACTKQLQLLGDSILKGSNDTVRLSAGEKFEVLVDSILHTEKGPDLSFGQQKALSVAISDDEKVKAITWLIQTANGNNYRYYGYLLQRAEKKDPWRVFRLQMNKDIVRETIETLKSDSVNWPGCIYYAVRHEKHKKKDYYLLLGWAPQSVYTTRKYIEPVVFSPARVTVGTPSIKVGGRARTRLVFEYNAQVTMSLRYNDKLNMIIMDHLASSDPRPESAGMYQLYGPDLSYDGLKFSKGQWILVKDVDVRN
ncbi:MAG TPA: hypothetical protein PLJ43_13475 [Chitinophagales bacterium]|nr:hypothetical protein [Chitinophagales bacterium]